MIPPVLLILVHLIYLSAICTHARTHAHAHNHFRCFPLKRLVFLRARSTIVKCRGPDNCSLQSCFVGDNRQKESERENLQRCTLDAAFLCWTPRALDSVIDEVSNLGCAQDLPPSLESGLGQILAHLSVYMQCKLKLFRTPYID